MKKLIILSLSLMLSIGLMAQRASSTTSIGSGTYKNLTMTAADTLTQGGTAYWTFDVGWRANPYYYAFAVALDTVTHATNRIAVTVWGSLDNTNWVSSGITQVNCFPTAGGGADTTLVMSSTTTPQFWRYLKVRFVSVDVNAIGSKVSALGLKIGERK